MSLPVVLGGNHPLGLPLIMELEAKGYIVITSVSSLGGVSAIESTSHGFIRALVLGQVRHCFVVRLNSPLVWYHPNIPPVAHIIHSSTTPPSGQLTPFNAYVALSRSRGRDSVPSCFRCWSFHRHSAVHHFARTAIKCFSPKVIHSYGSPCSCKPALRSRVLQRDPRPMVWLVS